MKIKIIQFIALISILSSCKESDVRYPVNVSSGVDYNSSIELAKKINQKEEKKFREYASNSGIEFERSNYGFQYNIEGIDSTSVHIESGDDVKFTFRVENLNGLVIYPQKERRLRIDQQNEIIGLHEGLKLMDEESSAIFLFPSHQAFGYHGDENKIKPNTPLLYRVNVLEVIKKSEINNN